MSIKQCTTCRYKQEIPSGPELTELKCTLHRVKPTDHVMEACPKYRLPHAQFMAQMEERDRRQTLALGERLRSVRELLVRDPLYLPERLARWMTLSFVGFAGIAFVMGRRTEFETLMIGAVFASIAWFLVLAIRIARAGDDNEDNE